MQNKLSYSIVPYSFINEKDIEFHSIGCEMSIVDAQQLKNRLLKIDSKKKKIVVSTCAVVQSAFWSSKELVRKLRMLNPDADIYITGCAKKYNINEFKEFKIRDLDKPDEFDDYGFNACKDSCFITPGSGAGIVKIQEGCSKSCSYCITRKLRGPSRSVSYDTICSQIKNILNKGYRCIQLVGTELCYYWSDGMNLPQLMKRILDDFPEIKSMTFEALDPGSTCIEDVIDVVKNTNKIENSMCLAVQSGTDEILKKMNRRHDCNRIRDIVKYAGQDFSFTWHLIVGFPGETEELFQKCIDFINEVKPSYLYINPYSNIKGTLSYDFPNHVNQDEIQRRISVLQKMNKDIFKYKVGYAVEHHDNDYFEQDSVTFVVNDVTNDQTLIELDERARNGFLDIVEFNFNSCQDLKQLELNLKYLNMKYRTTFFTKIELTDNISRKIIKRELDTFYFRDFLLTKVQFVIPDKFDFDTLKHAIVELYKQDKKIVRCLKKQLSNLKTENLYHRKIANMIDLLDNENAV